MRQLNEAQPSPVQQAAWRALWDWLLTSPSPAADELVKPASEPADELPQVAEAVKHDG